MSKTKLQNTIRRDGPISHSFFQYKHNLSKLKLSKTMKQLCPPQIAVYNNTLRLTAGIGLQAYTGWAVAGGYQNHPSMWNVNDIKLLFSQANILSNNTNSDVPNPNTQKIYLKKATFELMITNQTNDPVHCTIYDCQARRDEQTNVNYYNPGAAWHTGASADMFNTNTDVVVGSTPFSMQSFVEHYQVQKVTTVDLHTGGHHQHRVVSKPMIAFSYEIVEALNSSASSAVRNLTSFPMVVIHGFPANDSTTKTQISTNNVGVDLIWKIQYEYELFGVSTSNITFTNNLPTTFTVAGEFVNDLTGALTNPTVVA